MKSQQTPRFIYLTDILVLSKLFGKPDESLLVYDPQHALVRNSHHPIQLCYKPDELEHLSDGSQMIISLSGESLPDQFIQQDFSILIDFSGAKIKSSLFNQHYLSFPNPDGTIRCFTPFHNNTPTFLNLYNGSGLRGWLYRQYYRWAYRFGLKSWVSKAAFIVYAAGEWPLSRLGFEVNDHQFSVFTGTAGPNRKLIIERSEKGKTTHFLKYPISNRSYKLVQNENGMLRMMHQLNLKNWVLPKPCNREGALLLNNVKPDRAFDVTELQTMHYAAMEELYLSNAEKTNLSELKVYHFIGRQLGLMHALDFSVSDLDLQSVGNLVADLDKAFHQLNSEKQVAVAIAHGDFTPWNQFVTKNKIHVYDWELGHERMPVLYDAFHFIFQSTTLIQQGDYVTIKEKIGALKRTEFIQSLQNNLDFDYDWHWRFYLLFTASYYLPIYLRQVDLFPQAHWLVRNWNDALRDAIQIKDKATRRGEKVGLLAAS